MLTSLRELARFATPIRFVVRSLLPRLRGAVIHVSLLAVSGAALNACGFLLLLPILNALAQGEQTLDLGPVTLDASLNQLTLLLLVVVAFVVSGLILRYRIQKESLRVQRLGAEEAAIIGLKRVRTFGDEIDVWRAVSRVAGKMASGCGFVMRQFSVGLADALQLGIFFAALVWLSPLLTLALTIPACAVLFYFSRSVTDLTLAVTAQQTKNRGVRDEVDAITDLIESGEVSDADLHEHLAALHRNGAHGASLEGRLDVRRELQRGPIIVEALFPLALVPLAIAALATDDWQQHAALFVVYILLLRTAIGLTQKLAAQIMTIGRFHPELTCFMALHSSDVPTQFRDQPLDDEDEDPA